MMKKLPKLIIANKLTTELTHSTVKNKHFTKQTQTYFQKCHTVKIKIKLPKLQDNLLKESGEGVNNLILRET